MVIRYGEGTNCQRGSKASEFLICSRIRGGSENVGALLLRLEPDTLTLLQAYRATLEDGSNG
jgi:hypothetical protein